MKAKFDIIQSLRIATKHHQHGRLAEAERIYVRILTKNPRQPDALHRLGILATRKGEAEVAVELLSRAVLLKPNVAEFYDDLGDALAALGRYDEAIAACRKAITLDKRLFRAYFHLGHLQGLTRRFDEAIASFQGALRINPNDAEMHNLLGFWYFSSHKLDEAFAEFNEAARLRPGAASIQMNLANTWLACARHDEARACFDSAVAAGPPTAERLSTRIMSMHYDPANDPAALLKAARQWNEAIAEPLRPSIGAHLNDRARIASCASATFLRISGITWWARLLDTCCRIMTAGSLKSTATPTCRRRMP